MDRRRAGRQAAVLLFSLALAVLKTGLWRDLDSALYAGPDPPKDVWVLHWVSTHLLRPGLWFEGNNLFPSHHAVLFSDPLLGPALLAAPLRALGAGPVLAFNLTILLVLALASYGFYRLAYRFTGDHLASLVPALVVPYVPPLFMHLPHLNLLTVAGFPFFMLALLRLLEAPSWRAGLAGGFWFAFQAGTSGYWAFAGAFLAVVFAAWGWRGWGRGQTWACSSLAVLLAAILLWPYLSGFRDLGQEATLSRGASEQAWHSLDLSRVLGTQSYVWKGLLRGEHDPVFPGFAVTALAAAGALRGPRHPVRLLLLMAALFFVLALGPEVRLGGMRLGDGPFAALQRVLPFLAAARHPVTFIVPALMSVGLLAAIGSQVLGLTRRPWAQAAMLCLIALETAAEPVRRVRWPGSRELPEVYRRLQGHPRGAILELPLEPHHDSHYQWWSIFHGLPLVNGVNSFLPDRYQELTHRVRGEWSRVPAASLEHSRSLSFLKHQFPLRYVVVHGAAAPVLRQRVEATPSFEPLFETAEARVYRLRNGGTGPLLRRRFRDDQLPQGRLRARLRGPEGTRLRATFNGTLLDIRPLRPEAQEWTWAVRTLVRPGLNALVLQAEGAGDPSLELIEIEAS